MITFREFYDLEIWPTRRGKEGEVRWQGKSVGWIKMYGFESFGLTLKGIRFQNGETRLAPGAKGKHFDSFDACFKYLISESCIAAIKEAAERRAACNNRLQARIPVSIQESPAL